MKRNKMFLVLGLLVGVQASFVLAADPVKLAFDTYSGYFVSNQFEPKEPESYVFLAGQKEFDAVFGVARVMGDRSHRLAKDAFKTSVVLAAIKRGNVVWDYKVESVTEDQGVVSVNYTTTSTKSETATFACPMIVTIPKGKYKTIQFFENKKLVKTLTVEKK